MFDFFSQILEHLAPFVVVTHLLFLSVVAIIGSLAVVLLAQHVVRFAGVATSCCVRFAGFTISSLGRFAVFAISWQPKDYVGAPRSHRLSDSKANPGTTADERHAPALPRETALILTLNDGDNSQRELLEMASESARKIRAKPRLSEDDVWQLRTLENLIEKIQARSDASS